MNVPKTIQKRAFLKAYEQIAQIEIAIKAIKAIKENSATEVVLSILGNFGEEHSNNPKGLANKKKYLETYFKELMGPDTDFDSFYNPETGYVFVTGFIVPMFLHRVGEKKIGGLSGGPYGILRGLGISKDRAATFLKKLNNGKYLLLVRGNRFDIQTLEGILEELEK